MGLYGVLMGSERAYRVFMGSYGVLTGSERVYRVLMGSERDA